MLFIKYVVYLQLKRNQLMHNYETSKDESQDMVNEPAFSSYYTRPMIAGLRNYLQRRLQEEKNLQTLLRVESALSQNGEETFAERYSRMKEYVFSHFDQMCRQ